MKKGPFIAVLLAAAALIMLGALTVYLTLQYKNDVFSPDSRIESEAEAAILALHETEAPKTDLSDDTADASAKVSIIWAGDSRTIGMRDAMKNQDIYIGASGEGYNWLSETGLPQIRTAIAENPGIPVVFNFGVNDYDNLTNYMELYESLLKEYPDTRFYFLSVNPIDPAICKNITNEEISDFNSHLKDLSPDTYLDSYTYLMVNEAVPIDGVHYSGETYQMIYEYAADQIRKRTAEG